MGGMLPAADAASAGATAAGVQLQPGNKYLGGGVAAAHGNDAVHCRREALAHAAQESEVRQFAWAWESESEESARRRRAARIAELATAIQYAYRRGDVAAARVLYEELWVEIGSRATCGWI